MNRAQRRKGSKKKFVKKHPIDALLKGIATGDILREHWCRTDYPDAHTGFSLEPVGQETLPPGERRFITIVDDPKFVNMVLFRGTTIVSYYMEKLGEIGPEFTQLLGWLREIPRNECTAQEALAFANAKVEVSNG